MDPCDIFKSMGCLLRCNSCGSFDEHMETVRWFSSQVEAFASEWRAEVVDARVWTEVDPDPDFDGHGEAQGFFVNCGSLDGYAKQSGTVFRAAHEKIASDLAYDLRTADTAGGSHRAGGSQVRCVQLTIFSTAEMDACYPIGRHCRINDRASFQGVSCDDGI